MTISEGHLDVTLWAFEFTKHLNVSDFHLTNTLQQARHIWRCSFSIYRLVTNKYEQKGLNKRVTNYGKCCEKNTWKADLLNSKSSEKPMEDVIFNLRQNVKSTPKQQERQLETQRQGKFSTSERLREGQCAGTRETNSEDEMKCS